MRNVFVFLSRKNLWRFFPIYLVVVVDRIGHRTSGYAFVRVNESVSHFYMGAAAGRSTKGHAHL